MRYPTFLRVAAGFLATAALATGAIAQVTAPTMTDTAPTPAHDRDSLGAVIMMDQPVLAQREALLAAQERTSVDTRSLGAGPTRIMREATTKEERQMQKALEEKGLNVTSAQLQRVPNTTVHLEGDQLEEVMNLIEKFEEDDDVQAVYHTLG